MESFSSPSLIHNIIRQAIIQAMKEMLHSKHDKITSSMVCNDKFTICEPNLKAKSSAFGFTLTLILKIDCYIEFMSCHNQIEILGRLHSKYFVSMHARGRSVRFLLHRRGDPAELVLLYQQEQFTSFISIPIINGKIFYILEKGCEIQFGRSFLIF